MKLQTFIVSGIQYRGQRHSVQLSSPHDGERVLPPCMEIEIDPGQLTLGQIIQLVA